MHNLVKGKGHVRVIPWINGTWIAIRVDGATGVWVSV